MTCPLALHIVLLVRPAPDLAVPAILIVIVIVISSLAAG
jgi:hypothetical protein